MQVICFQWELARRQLRCAHRIRTATSWPWETYCECEICECVSKWGNWKLNFSNTTTNEPFLSALGKTAATWQLLTGSSYYCGSTLVPIIDGTEGREEEVVRDHGGGRGERLFEVISRWGCGAEVGVGRGLLCGPCLLIVSGERKRETWEVSSQNWGTSIVFADELKSVSDVCFFPPRHLLPTCLCFAPSEVLKSMRRKKHCDCCWYTEGLCSRKL